MLSKNDIKRVNSLKIKKYRSIEGVFIAEGPKIIPEFINAGWKCEFIATTEAHLPIFSDQNQLNIKIIDEEILSKISALQHPQGCLGVFEIKIPSLIPDSNRWSLVLDGIQDPGNLGTLIRIADWFGMQGIFCSEDTVDIYNPKVIQATMGSAARIPVQYGSLETLFTQNASIPVYGGLLEGTPIQEANMHTPGFLLIGNEGNGIRPHILPFITQAITIPKLGEAESLNAGVAAGIMAGFACLKH
jgi:TrmH family RNA methyltransferase